MKTLKLFFTCILLAVAVSISAQDTYRTALKNYASANPSLQAFSSDRMKPLLSTLSNQLLTGESLEKSEELTDRYLKEQFFDDIIDMMLPSMKEHVSEAELKELTTIISTPEGKSFAQNNMKWESSMEEDLTDFMGKAASIINGGTPEPIQVNGNISKSYEKKFRTFIESSNQLELFKKGLNLGSQNQLPQQVVDWVMENAPNYFINTGYGILSEADLDYGIKLSANSSYQNALKAAMSLSDDAMSVGMKLVTNYMTWLKAQGASVVDLPF